MTVQCRSELVVLALRGFVSMPTDDLPPYTRLYQACEDVSETQLNALMMTELMDVATNFKWETYCKRRMYIRLTFYMLHFALAAVVMLISSRLSSEQTSGDHKAVGWGIELSLCDVLQTVLLVSNTVVLYREINQVTLLVADDQRKRTEAAGWLACLRGLRSYASSGWNLIDATGIWALYCAIFAHRTGSELLMQRVGSLGVLLNAFSVLQLLSPFDVTGPLIKMLIEILRDMKGFLILLAVLLWGFSISFGKMALHTCKVAYCVQYVSVWLTWFLCRCSSRIHAAEPCFRE
eukprot:COSAG06_NODE_16133_length_1020_cov_1.287731_1_plen_292_part_10